MRVVGWIVLALAAAGAMLFFWLKGGKAVPVDFGHPITPTRGSRDQADPYAGGASYSSGGSSSGGYSSGGYSSGGSSSGAGSRSRWGSGGGKLGSASTSWRGGSSGSKAGENMPPPKGSTSQQKEDAYKADPKHSTCGGMTQQEYCEWTTRTLGNNLFCELDWYAGCTAYNKYGRAN